MKTSDFITRDGSLYFAIAQKLRKVGICVFDEISILSNLDGELLDKYNDKGGFEPLDNLVSITELKNYDAYLDKLYKENIILHLHQDGFNLTKPLVIDGKEIIPVKLFKEMDSDDVLSFYESRLSACGCGYSNKIIEKGYIDFDDQYFNKMDSGEETGVPFDIAGDDINLEEMRCFPFLSGQIGGFYDGTFNVLGGHSSVGKSVFWTTIAMALAHRDRKILIISNEQKMKVFKDNFFVFILYKYFRYYDITKKKIRNAALTDKDKEMRKKAQNYWREHYKEKIEFISIVDADTKLVKKIIREEVLQNGFDTVIYDTMKLDFEENKDSQMWLSLVKDSREFDKIAKKYNIIMLASLQLAMNTKGKLFMDGSELSMSKQSIEVMETLLLLRSVYSEEVDKDNKKYYCHPFRLVKTDSGWIEQEYIPDPTATYKALFVAKGRNGENSNDNGKGYLLIFDGGHGIFREVAQARFKHGYIGSQ